MWNADPTPRGHNLDPTWVDPNWQPPPPPKHRPTRAAYVFAVILPIVLLAWLALPGLAVWLLARSEGGVIGQQGDPPRQPTSGSAGAGDPYFPDYGSGGYDAIKYAISVSFDPDSQTLSGTTTITGRAEHDLASFYVDFVLDVDQVSVNGAAAEAERTGFQDVLITPADQIDSGAVFSVEIRYSGNPASVTPSSRHPWSVTNQEWTAAGEPESSAWWFPANDYPEDPALMDVKVRVPAGMEALSVGRLESRDADDETDFDTWHWVARQPMATYLNFLSIGQYELRTGETDGLRYVYAATEQLSAEDRATVFDHMAESGKIVRDLEKFFGPYPFTEIGGVVPAHRLGFGGLETQTRPVYQADAMLDPGGYQQLIAHELTHMWFGDNVTVRQWNDICTNECWASWGQWAWAADHGGEKLDDRLLRVYGRVADDPDYWRTTLIDPGADNLFTVVYSRGPMMLQALRNRIGDEAFLSLARDWAQRSGSRSLEEWMVKAQSTTSVDLVPFFDAWIYGDTAPARTKENGFP